MTPSAPRPALTPEREKELLGLIEAFWRIKGLSPAIHPHQPQTFHCGEMPPRVEVDLLPDADGANNPFLCVFDAKWAESEACLREVAGESALRCEGAHIDLKEWSGGGYRAWMRRWPGIEPEDCHVDPSRPVALLRAFVAAFGSEPRHE